jgi:type II secretory pathway pseudopilin PulG
VAILAVLVIVGLLLSAVIDHWLTRRKQRRQ